MVMVMVMVMVISFTRLKRNRLMTSNFYLQMCRLLTGHLSRQGIPPKC